VHAYRSVLVGTCYGRGREWRVTRTPTARSSESNADLSNGSLVRLALRREEAAAALGVSTDFFDEQIRPELRAVRVGRRRVFRVAELERWLKANETRVEG
jgi:excisionase family DNA binding protein